MKPRTRGDEVFERMLDMIYSCRLAPGEVVNESALAAEFGVSRGPVREAVRRLQGIQLVSREPYLRARVVSLEAKAVLELFQMREALEGYACRLAAEQLSEDDIGALAVGLERSRRAALAGGDGTANQVFDFHERIVRGCGNARIVDSLCGDLYHLLRICRLRSGEDVERKSEAYAEHWQILRAIRARDGELAESLMRSHIRRAAAHLTKRLEGSSGMNGGIAAA